MKAILNPDLTFRELVPDSFVTDPTRTRAWVPAQPPSVTAGEVAVESVLVTETEAQQVWTVRAKTTAELAVTWPCLEFLARFTPDELAGARQYAPQLLETLLAAHEVTNNDPLTVYGMEALVAGGLLTEARKNEILAP